MKHNQPERLSEKTPGEKMFEYPCDFIKSFCETPQPAYRHEPVTQQLIDRYEKVCGNNNVCEKHTKKYPVDAIV